MKSMTRSFTFLAVIAMALSLSACADLSWKTQTDPPKDGYKKVHHTITFEAEPQCVGSCDPTRKSW